MMRNILIILALIIFSCSPEAAPEVIQKEPRVVLTVKGVWHAVGEETSVNDITITPKDELSGRVYFNWPAYKSDANYVRSEITLSYSTYYIREQSLKFTYFKNLDIIEAENVPVMRGTLRLLENFTYTRIKY